MAKILVVDDEEDLEILFRQKYRQKIRNGEYNMLFALNGQVAMDTLRDHPDVDVILSDINMPVMDGWEFMEQFVKVKKQFTKPITIYIASSSIAKQDIEKSQTYSEISGYIVKPILKDAVANLLIAKKAV